MSRVWFTADTHFGHANIIKYCMRPFLSDEEKERAANDPRGSWKVEKTTVQRHDEALLAAINECVSEQDEFWILGDFCLGKQAEAKYYLDRMRCKNVKLVWGNHDHRSVGPLFVETVEQRMISIDGQKIWLNHYPMRSWDGRFHGSWQLYGHVHNRMSDEDRQNPSMLTKDVGVDACDYRPVSFSQLVTYMKPRVAAFEKSKAAFVSGKGPSVD